LTRCCWSAVRNRIRPDTRLQLQGHKIPARPPSCMKFCAVFVCKAGASEQKVIMFSLYRTFQWQISFFVAIHGRNKQNSVVSKEVWELCNIALSKKYITRLWHIATAALWRCVVNIC
jgi:hypothetical protein